LQHEFAVDVLPKNKWYHYTTGEVMLHSSYETFTNSKIPTAVEMFLTPNP